MTTMPASSDGKTTSRAAEDRYPPASIAANRSWWARHGRAAMILCWQILLLVAVIAVQSALWYSAVALVLSTPLARRHYARLGFWLDRIAGVVMIGLGLKLASELRDEIARVEQEPTSTPAEEKAE